MIKGIQVEAEAGKGPDQGRTTKATEHRFNIRANHSVRCLAALSVLFGCSPDDQGTPESRYIGHGRPEVVEIPFPSRSLPKVVVATKPSFVLEHRDGPESPLLHGVVGVSMDDAGGLAVLANGTQPELLFYDPKVASWRRPAVRARVLASSVR